MPHSEILKKCAAFLEEFQDVYGTTLIVNDQRIREIQLEYQNFIDSEPDDSERERTIDIAKEDQPKTDHPLWKFEQEINQCTKCALGSTRQKFVFGSGNPDADIMFIGEAPGAEEDRTGIPFVGRAGKLLEKLLAGIQLKREDIFIANILKCRPPNNRDPQPDEVAQCYPYLHKQIEIIQPRVIVSLGRIAAQNLLQTTSPLKQMRERLWQYRGVDMIVTYHPAAILRNGGLMNASQADFKYISDTLREKLKRHA